jgi:uncharacterized protein YceK
MKKLLLTLLVLTILSGCTYVTKIPIQGNHRIFEEGKKCAEANELFIITHTCKRAICATQWHCETFKRVIEFE